MKFGESFVFPDPASRVKNEPLKLVTDPRVAFRTFVHCSQERTNLGSERGKFTKVNLSISAGARGLCGFVGLVLRPRAVARGRARFRCKLDVLQA
jgi:hypothetical protein